MKLYPNLAGSLRFYFGVARGLTVFIALVWAVFLIGPSFIHRQVGDDAKLRVSVGEVILRTTPGAVGLKSTSAPEGSLSIDQLRGSLTADMISTDASLVSALRWSVFPSMAVFVGFLWMLLTSLRSLCANVEKGDIFSAENLRLVRRSGIILLAFSVTGIATRFGSAYLMNAYLANHVSLIGIASATESAAVQFAPASWLFPGEGGFVTGFLVLMLAQAFRQGLSLKTESDLTV